MFRKRFSTKKIASVGLSLAAALVTIATGILSGCSGGGEKRPIVLADGSWDSIQVHSRIAAFIIKNGYGYDTEFTFGDTIPLFNGLSRGDIDVTMEVWVENQQNAYDEFTANGSVIDLGSNYSDNWQGWLVPTYMINGDVARGIQATAPDLKSVFDLPKYWQLFKDPETPGKGRFVNGPTGWEATTINAEKLKVYGLLAYYTDFIAGSDTALSSSLASAYEQGKPWFGYYWEPTWVLGKYDMTRLEEPAYDPAIWNSTHACAYPANKVNICVNDGFYNRFPKLVDFLSKYTTTTQMLNEILAYMRDNHASTEQAAEYFLKNYKSIWTPWVPADVAAKVNAALG
ncbi:MAG: ABC transporter substrate-binding protein [Dehalococcoidia bacterium]|nr:MAG: ABC transporter substrate-binding protein [Dehalococcoidia bacterium]